mmetsp:Transcript_7984/g.35310  ORF Transcript_7984/g.35310 Transcript_7984/m.35310 type:complete len:239 (-) Transcript_7984:32-748(-)
MRPTRGAGSCLTITSLAVVYTGSPAASTASMPSVACSSAVKAPSRRMYSSKVAESKVAESVRFEAVLKRSCTATPSARRVPTCRSRGGSSARCDSGRGGDIAPVSSRPPILTRSQRVLPTVEGTRRDSSPHGNLSRTRRPVAGPFEARTLLSRRVGSRSRWHDASATPSGPSRSVTSISCWWDVKAARSARSRDDMCGGGIIEARCRDTRWANGIRNRRWRNRPASVARERCARARSS